MASLFNTIYTGTLQQYQGLLPNVDANALYMLNDTTGVKSMYRGTTKVAGDFIIVNGGAPENPEKGTIYYISAFVKEGGKEGKPYVGFYDGTKWVPLSDSATIESLDTRITALENATKIDGTATEGSIGAKVAQLDGGETVEGSVKKQIKDAVEALDVTDAEIAGSVVVAVNEVDGKVSNVKKAVAVTKQETPNEGQQATYDVTIGTQSVGKIDIPFCDAVLANAVLADMNATVDTKTGVVTPGDPKGPDALVMVFKKGDKTYVDVKVNISTILVESEFKSGLAVSDNGEVSVKLVANNDYLKFGTAAEGENAPLVANVVTLANAKAAAEGVDAVTGLADALDVKTTITENEKVTAAALADLNTRVGEGPLKTTAQAALPAINELKDALDSKNVDAEGDTYVSASATGNKVTVAATDSTKASLAKADTAVQTIVAETADQEVTVSTKSAENGYTIGVTKAAYTAASDDYKTNGEFTAEGLVNSTVLKAYIADQIAMNAVYWKAL